MCHFFCGKCKINSDLSWGMNTCWWRSSLIPTYHNVVSGESHVLWGSVSLSAKWGTSPSLPTYWGNYKMHIAGVSILHIKVLSRYMVLFRDGHELPQTKGTAFSNFRSPREGLLDKKASCQPFSIPTPLGSVKLQGTIKIPLCKKLPNLVPFYRIGFVFTDPSGAF